ncbi:putative transcription factor MYB-HB-like family [Helianthus debilis subsp. tardiflorus]
MDPTRGRIYNSTDEFDDEIPTDCSPQDFFKVFGPASMRNGRCWREFPHEDEYNLEKGESRDHKRWVERQNAKLSEKVRKEEHARIRSLVDNVYKRDPRILRRKETLKAEKQKKKEAKFMAKKLQEEEATRIAEENRRKKEEEDKLAAEAALNQKKLKEKEKKLLRKERTRLRTISTTVVSNSLLNLSQDDVENICMSLDMLQFRSLCDNMEQKEGDSQSQAELLKHAKPWGKEEIELLRKGIAKYPKGTSRRWEVISEYIGTGRSVEEILEATKTVLLLKPDSTKAFDSFLEKRKLAISISSPLTTREEVVGVSSTSTSKSTPTRPDVTQPKLSQDVDKVEPVGSSSDQDVWSSVHETTLVALSTCSLYMQ